MTRNMLCSTSSPDACFTAVIPVKAHSSRLPGKNLKPLGAENLLTRKIRQVIASGIADRIIVSSDSHEMLAQARSAGVEAVERPHDLADESRPLGDFFDYIASLVGKGHLIWACATSPYFGVELMRRSKEAYLNALAQNYDSLITVYKFRHYLLDERGPVNYSLGYGHLNSQDLPAMDLFTNGILYAPIENVACWHYNYGPHAFRFEVNQKEALDIDTPLDYLCALGWYDPHEDPHS